MKLPKLLWVAVCCLWYTGSSYAQALPIKIVVYGDSLTSGHQFDASASFPAMLERKLRSDGYNATVSNLSEDGQTMADGAKNINKVLALNPDIVIVQFGVNDAFRGVDIAKVIYPNLNTIVGALRERQIGVLLCGIKEPNLMNEAYSKALNKMFYTSASYYKTSYYPNILKGVTGRADLTLADGLHPNEKGILTMIHGIYPTVEQLVKWRQKYLDFEASQH